ncbi:MAG: hypothetical protein R8M14_03590 [Ghiorsea sp.]
MKNSIALALLCVGLLCSPNMGFAKKVYSPTVSQGELELETQNEILRNKDASLDGNSKYQVELAYGVTDSWNTGVYKVFEKKNGSGLSATQNKWANIIQLSDAPKGYVNFGMYIEYIWAASGVAGPDVLELKGLFEQSMDSWKHTLNLVGKKPLASGSTTSLGYAWRSRYKMESGFESAIEMYGSMGNTSHITFNGSSILIGPVVEYELFHGFEASAGWLMDTNQGMAYGDFKFNLEYEF